MNGFGFQRTPVVLNLLIINALVYFAQAALSAGNEGWIYDYGALHHYRSEEFRVYQIFTSMFMHGGFFHLFFNMFALWMFGSTMETYWGSKRFITFYLICGVGAGLTQLANYAYDYSAIDKLELLSSEYDAYQELLRLNVTVGASGAIMGVLAAYGLLFPNTRMFIMPIPFPIKAKFAIMGIIALDVFGGISKVPGDNIAHFAHVGGALVGLAIAYYWHRQQNRRSY